MNEHSVKGIVLFPSSFLNATKETIGYIFIGKAYNKTLYIFKAASKIVRKFFEYV